MTQADLFAGETAKAEGVALVSVNGADFLEAARTEAKAIALRYGTVSTDEIRDWAERHRIRPHHRNAWGAVFAGKGWVCVGRKRSRLPSNHAREIRVWRLS